MKLSRRDLYLVLLGFVMASWPQFESASSLADLSEVKDVGVGGGSLAAAIFLVNAVTRPRPRREDEEGEL